jgi:hypothetical protein
VTVLGAAHVGIEDMLAMSNESRLANIKSLMPLIRKVIDPAYFYKAVQYVYNGSEWKVQDILEIPELKALV